MNKPQVSHELFQHRLRELENKMDEATMTVAENYEWEILTALDRTYDDIADLINMAIAFKSIQKLIKE